MHVRAYQLVLLLIVLLCVNASRVVGRVRAVDRGGRGGGLFVPRVGAARLAGHVHRTRPAATLTGVPIPAAGHRKLARKREPTRVQPPLMAASGSRGSLQARLIGSGSCVPETRVTNFDLAKIMDTTDEWISKRTGIASRKLLQPSEGVSKMATIAAQRALDDAGVSGEDVDLVIVATCTPDDLFGDAAHVASIIGATNAAAFDITAACSGFLLAMTTASQYLHNGAYKTAVVVAADGLSRWVDWSDRNTCILFGDGAGAVVMKTADGTSEPGVLGYEMHSDGRGRASLNIKYAGEERLLPDVATVTNGKYACLNMTGKEVFKFATSRAPEVLQEALVNAAVTAEEVDWLVLHQANIRIIESVAKKLGIPMEKVITNLSEVGNTGAASIPLVLDSAVRSGKIKKGDLIAMAGFGAGLTWGAAIVRWG